MAMDTRVTRLWGHGPGRPDTCPGFTHPPPLDRLRLVQQHGPPQRDREESHQQPQGRASYLLLGFHTNACASASLGQARSVRGADISASERRKRNAGSDACREYLGVRVPQEQLGTARGSAGPTPPPPRHRTHQHRPGALLTAVMTPGLQLLCGRCS